jgi:transglutaminase-like putative cysteine protease
VPRYLHTFRSGREKACYLDGRAREDARLPAVRALAATVRHLPPAARVEALYRRVRDGIRYRHDPPPEELADAATVLETGADDCDGKAALLVSLLLAAGVEARVRGVLDEDTDDLEHVQAEARWSGSAHHPLAAVGGWVLLETTRAGVELGQGAEAGRPGPGGELLQV